MTIRRFVIELEDSLKGFEEDLENLERKYGAEELKSDIVPVIVKDGYYEFDGLLDRQRQLLYGKPYTAEYVREVLGMDWEEVDT